jgi:hypothetical protein
MTRPQSKAAARLAIDKPHEVIVRQEFNVEADHASGLRMRREVLRNNKFPGVGGGRGCTRCFCSCMDVAAVLGRQP